MAIYGYDYYGLSRYGSAVHTDFGVDPFVAEPISYDKIKLSWTEPSGTWTAFTVLRSRTGYAVNETDGLVLYRQDTGGATPGSITDEVATGGWYYYTIYMYDSTQSLWVRAATTSTLAVNDFGSKALLWDRVPVFFKTIRASGAGFSPVDYGINPAIYLDNIDTADNEHLRSILDVFAFGFDLVRSQNESTLWGSDPSKMHFDRLALRADEMGAEIARSVPAQMNRNLVQNLGLLYRKRGTLSGLQETLGLATGWRIDVNLGPNIMLSEDQANFINPVVLAWDATTRYVVGEYVKFNSRFFISVAVAYGAAATPPASGDNAFWHQVVNVVEDTTVKSGLTGNIGTWEAYGSSSGPLTADTATHVGLGVPHPTDGAILATNALGIKNTSGGTQDMTVLNVPMPIGNTVYDREFTVKSAIPVPVDNEIYSATKRYVAGNLVHYKGVAYVATRVTLGNLPTVTTYWSKVGYDRRVRLALSFYAHGPFTGTGGTGGLVVKPVVVAYDETGALMWSQPLDSTLITDVNYDTFNTAAAISGRTLELGGKAWTVVTGTLNQTVDDNIGGYVYPGAALAYATVPVGLANVSLGITYLGVGARNAGILFRYVDANNHWRAEQGRLVKVVAGVVTSVATYTPFVAGDRMTLDLNGSNIVVRKNVVIVANVTDAFQSSATVHGIIFE